MKKLLCIICAAVMALAPVGTFAQEAEDSYTETEVRTVNEEQLAVAKTLLGAITDEMPFESDTVTRGEFVGTVADIMLIGNAGSDEAVYSDVTADYKYFSGINAAANLGWISKAEKFNPDVEIQLSEALKILVCAAKYGDKAMLGGGYPEGYMKEANNIKLLKGIGGSGTAVTPDMAKLMVYNLLRVNYLDIEISGTTTKYKPTDKTILGKLYDVDEVEGVVNYTPYNSFEYNSAFYTETKYIEIEGERYRYDDAQYNLLGRSVQAFVKDETVIAIETDQDNTIFTCDLNDISMDSEGKIEYSKDGGKSKTIKFTSGIAVYNGRTIRSLTSDYCEKDGYAEFIDNNEDGTYDIVHITAYSYVTVGNVDIVNTYIGDSNSASNSLDFSNVEDGRIELYDENGERISIYGIANGMVLEAIVPEDVSFASVSVISRTVVGKVDTVGEDSIVIDGTEYDTTEYFDKYYRQDVTSGFEGKFYLGYGDRIVLTDTKRTGYSYAFLMRAFQEDDFEDGAVSVKVFASEGKQKNIQLADRVFIDGEKITSKSSVMQILNSMMSSDITRMFRYETNTAGLIIKMDFPLEYDYENYEALTADEDNKMIYYPQFNRSMYYRNGKTIFTGDVSLASAKCFMMPENLNDDEVYFKAGLASDVLVHNTWYTPFVYDVDDDGYAGAVVVRTIDTEYGGGDYSYVVEKVIRTIDNDNEEMNLVKCWANNKMYEFYLPDSVAVKKNSGDTLVPGDIIRVKLDRNNHIYNLRVDFDYTAFGMGSGADYYMVPTNSRSYWDGMAYSADINNKVLRLISGENEYGEPDLSISSIKTLSCATSNIMRFDCRTKKVSPATAKEIKTWREFRENCDYIVMRCDYDSPSVIIVYDGYNK